MESVITHALRSARTRIERRLSSSRAPLYLVSAAGQPNFGDEFITRAWLDWLAVHQPRREVWLDCLEPGRAAHLFRDSHPRLRTTNTLWQTAHSGPWHDPHAAAARMSNLVLNLGSPKVDFGLRDLRAVRSVHLLGGGYINTLWRENLAIVAAMTALKRQFGIRIFATGQGLLPHDGDSKSWLREQLALFDYAEARDRKSADMFDIVFGTDDAFLAFVNKRPIYAQYEHLPEKMVLIQGDGVDEKRTSEFERLIDEFTSRAESVGFAEGIPPEDTRFAANHVADGAELFPFMRMWEEGFPARSGQEWLTTRFHFHLLAAAAGARGTIVTTRPGYYDVKHESLLALGTGWRMQPSEMTEQTTAPDGSAEFAATARRLGAEKSALAKRLYGRARRRG